MPLSVVIIRQRLQHQPLFLHHHTTCLTHTRHLTTHHATTLLLTTHHPSTQHLTIIRHLITHLATIPWPHILVHQNFDHKAAEQQTLDHDLPNHNSPAHISLSNPSPAATYIHLNLMHPPLFSKPKALHNTPNCCMYVYYTLEGMRLPNRWICSFQNDMISTIYSYKFIYLFFYFITLLFIATTIQPVHLRFTFLKPTFFFSTNRKVIFVYIKTAGSTKCVKIDMCLLVQNKLTLCPFM